MKATDLQASDSSIVLVFSHFDVLGLSKDLLERELQAYRPLTIVSSPFHPGQLDPGAPVLKLAFHSPSADCAVSVSELPDGRIHAQIVDRRLPKDSIAPDFAVALLNVVTAANGLILEAMGLNYTVDFEIEDGTMARDWLQSNLLSQRLLSCSWSPYIQFGGIRLGISCPHARGGEPSRIDMRLEPKFPEMRRVFLSANVERGKLAWPDRTFLAESFVGGLDEILAYLAEL